MAVLLKLNTHKYHECHTHQTYGDEGDADALERCRDVAVAHLLADGRKADDGEVPADT